MTKRRTPAIGDVFEIQTPAGLAFFQYVNCDELMGEFIRVFRGTYKSRPDSLDEILASNEQFFAFFPVEAALRKKLITFVGSAPVPLPLVNRFPTLRAPGRINTEEKKVENWRLWDGERSWGVETLTDEQRDFSIRGIMSAALLVHRIVTGWVPRDYG
jgi:hypothetical protein